MAANIASSSSFEISEADVRQGNGIIWSNTHVPHGWSNQQSDFGSLKEAALERAAA